MRPIGVSQTTAALRSSAGRLVWLAVAAMAMAASAACQFDRAGLEDKRACDGEHPCPAGEMCMAGECRSPTGSSADGGSSGSDAGPTGDEDPGPAPDLGTGGGCPGAVNACGGCADLVAEPGTTCGECGDGRWVCVAGGEAVECQGGGAVNACGGCSALVAQPGSPCGPCGLDEVICAGPESTICSGESTNLCGGCAELDPLPDRSCGPCGLDTTVCDGPDRVVCGGSSANRCGGCAELTTEPGDACGVCGLDTYACSGPDAVTCSGDTVGNECGGCDELDEEPGTTCSCGGEGQASWRCAGENAVECSDGDADPSDGRDLGDVVEDQSVAASGWIDVESDVDFYRADVVQDQTERTLEIRAGVQLRHPPRSPPLVGICAFYEYDDERGGNLAPYDCGLGACVYVDISEDAVFFGDCSDAGDFDPSEDLHGCCSAYLSTGPEVATLLAIDTPGATNNDTGTAYVLVFADHDEGDTICSEYDLLVSF